MHSSTVPRIRVEYANLYPCGTVIDRLVHPNVHEDVDLHEVYLRYEENDAQKNLFRRWTTEISAANGQDKVSAILDQYRQHWQSRQYGSRFFDLHGHEFQTFAVHVTNHLTSSDWRQLSVSRSQADRRLLRARVYAIGSRDDLQWDGHSIDDDNNVQRKRKKRQLIEHLRSLQLFDWFAPHCPSPSRPSTSSHPLQIRVTRQGTQEAVEEAHGQLSDPSKLIAWVNFAAGHNVCGSYSLDFGGSQEEEVATNCDGAVLLGTIGQFVDSGLKSWLRGRWAMYKRGMHIPPGGNYWAQTRFITGPSHVECAMIATAFADFRPYLPVFCPFSERSYFQTTFGRVKNQEELQQRCRLDIEGVLKTCLAKGVHTLVTGASGCGAFRHNSFVEAKLWRECLSKDEFRCGSLEQVIFAVLDREDSDNWIAFRNEFQAANEQKTE